MAIKLLAMARTAMTREESRRLTRERLIDAAAAVFAERGYRRASVEEIAARAGYTIGALYSNFSGKEEVLLALLEQRVAQIAERIVTAALQADTPTDKLRAGAREWMEFLDDEPELYALMVEFWTIWVRDDEQRPHHGRRFAAVREYIGGLIQQKADEIGVTMALPPDQIGAVVLALADGLALQYLANPDAVPKELFPSVLPILIQALEEPGR
jgi:AcrR family transcriptional regulator